MHPIAGGPTPASYRLARLVSAGPVTNYPRYRLSRSGGAGARLRRRYRYIHATPVTAADVADKVVNDPAASDIANVDRKEVSEAVKRASKDDRPPPALPEAKRSRQEGKKRKRRAPPLVTAEESPAEVVTASVSEAASEPAPTGLGDLLELDTIRAKRRRRSGGGGKRHSLTVIN